MKTFFLFMLAVSIFGTGAAYYWKTVHPEAGAGISSYGNTQKHKSIDRSKRRRFVERVKNRRSSRRQDKIFNMAIASSALSMLGTLLSLIFAYRADRRASRAEKRGEG